MVLKIATPRHIYKHIKYNMYIYLLRKGSPNCDLQDDASVFTT